MRFKMILLVSDQRDFWHDRFSQRALKSEQFWSLLWAREGPTNIGTLNWMVETGCEPTPTKLGLAGNPKFFSFAL